MKYLNRNKIATLLISSLLLWSCNNESKDSNGMMPTESQVESKKQSTNAISQSMPSIIVFPSDAMLSAIGLMKEINNQGVVNYQRDYQTAFIKSPELKFAIAAIEEEFAKVGFPLEDLEQQLKKINNDAAMDEMTDIARDLRAELLNTARPDYIIELDYNLHKDNNSRGGNKALNYTLKCLDVYTTKSVSAITKANAGKDLKENDVASIIKTDIAGEIGAFKDQITGHFADLLANGIEVTLRVATTNEGGVQLDDDCGNEEIGEKINTWMKENTVNQSFKMSKNTSTEMFFTSVRIYAQDENGNKYTAYDFASDLRKSIKNGCSLDVKNKTQSIGDALILIEGTK
jgi:hypothetical protein